MDQESQTQEDHESYEYTTQSLPHEKGFTLKHKENGLLGVLPITEAQRTGTLWL